MTFPLLNIYIYHFTLFVFYALYVLWVVSVEAFYHVYLIIIVENVFLPAVDALWTTNYRLVRLGCRIFLAPQSFLLFYMLNNRHTEKIRAVEWHKEARNSAAQGNEYLLRKEGYCVSDLVTFVKAQLVLIWSGIDLKFKDGKRLQELYLYATLKSSYSRPLQD